jgi:hypothetical protein
VGPFRRLLDVATHDRTRTTVKAGSQIFGTIRNVVAIGAAVASIATGGFFATRDRTTVTPSPSAAPIPLLAQLKGPLAFEVSFVRDLGTPPPLPSGARPTAQVKPRVDGVDIVGPGTGTPLIIRHALPAKYVAEAEIAVEAGTDGFFNVTLRSAGLLQYQILLDPLNEIVRFQLVDNSVTPSRTTSLVPSVIPAAGLQRGQTLRLAFAVDGSRYRVFVAGELVADVTDARIPVPDSPSTSLSLGAGVTKGTISINALRVYGLVEPAAPLSLLAQLQGQLIYEPSFTRDLGTPPPLASGARPTAQVRARGNDAVDIVPSGIYTPVILNRQIPARYLAKLDVVTATGTDGSFTWNLRFAAGRQIFLVVDPINEVVRLTYLDSTVTPNVNLSLTPSAAAVSGVQQGRVLHLAITVDGTRYRAFIDGDLFADVTDTHIAVPPSSTTSLTFGGALTKGGYTVSKVGVYELRDAPASPSPSGRP